MRFLTPSRLGALGCQLVLLFLAGPLFGAAPTITSATAMDIYYNIEDPANVQFAFQVVASGATAFDATGLPPNATINRATGLINGSRNSPGAYDVAVSASNSDGTAQATVRLAIHPTVIGVQSTAGVFHSGQAIQFTLVYNTAVTVSGAPSLAIAIGPADAPILTNATYLAGSGTTQLVFQHLIAAGEADPDGVQLLPSAPSGGTISDASGLVASPTLPVRYFVSGITIAADAPAPATPPTAASTVSNRVLVNVSARMRVVDGDASRQLITGFVIAGTQPKRVLLRAIGPTLSAFGVSGVLPDPQLNVYSSAGALVAANDNWNDPACSTVAAAVGAFALSPGSRDAAVVVTLPPGAYTLIVAPNGGSGVALAEVYDADSDSAAGTSAITNLSTRGQIDGDSSPLIAGFAVNGASVRRVLVRGVGPSLALFGLGAVLADPILTIYQNGQPIAQNDDWGSVAADVSAASAASGAFALANGSKDAAIVVSLPPGSYTAVVSGAGNTSGAALVEVYELPPNE